MIRSKFTLTILAILCSTFVQAQGDDGKTFKVIPVISPVSKADAADLCTGMNGIPTGLVMDTSSSTAASGDTLYMVACNRPNTKPNESGFVFLPAWSNSSIAAAQTLCQNPSKSQGIPGGTVYESVSYQIDQTNLLYIQSCIINK